MTREEAICRADEVMAGLGFVDRGRGCLEQRGFGQRFHSAELVAGRAANARVGDPYWSIQYEAVFVEDDGTLRPTFREQTSVWVDVVSGYAETFTTA